jgi:hypothetical protein
MLALKLWDMMYPPEYWVYGSLLAGLLQWLLLRWRARVSAWWIVATGGPWFVVGLLVRFGIVGRYPTGRMDLFMITYIVVGVAQWLLLRGHVRGSGWWLVASIPAPLLGQVIGSAVREPWLWMGLGQAISGVTTGIVLVWLLRRPLAEQEPSLA